MVPLCDSCTKTAVYYNPRLGIHLCEDHLTRSVEERVLETIRQNHLVRDGDLVAVGLSGGKDSSVLLSILCKVIPGEWDAGIVALTVDEGIAGYREETLRSATRLVKKLGVPHSITTFHARFGRDLDSIMKIPGMRPCTACGILRKKALFMMAREASATCIATGHNLDDAAQSVLMNYFRGDLVRLVRDTTAAGKPGFLRRIKPLSGITEKEITLYSFIHGITGVLPECPYATTSFRAEVRSLQAAIEFQYPGSSIGLVQGQESIRAALAGRMKKDPFLPCTTCGDPCSGGLCQACRLLGHLPGRS